MHDEQIFRSMITQDLEDAAMEGILHVKALGACGAEAFMSVSRSRKAKVQNGALEDLTSSKRGGLGVRVLRHGTKGIQAGSATTTDMTRRDLKDIFQQAWELSALGDEDPWVRQEAEQKGVDDLPSRFDARAEALKPADRIERAHLLEEAARKASPKVCAVRDSSWADGSGAGLLLTDKGIRTPGIASSCSASIELAAEHDNDRQAAWHWDMGRHPDSFSIEAIGSEAARKAEAKLNPRQLPAGKYPVVLHPEVVVDLFGIVVSMLNAESVLRGRSLFADKIGQTIASPLLTLIDDGRLPEGLGSSPWDGEGVPTQRNVLIQDGVLISYLHNLRTAAEMGVPATANASRGTTGNPGITIFNLFPKAGTKRAEGIITQAHDGVMITEIMGLHTVNPVSGDMSVGASGLRIRNGSLEESVDRMTFAGNLRDMLLNITEVGSDLRWYGASAGLTILLEEMTLGGS
ncbi:MAG: TldD/PmbA family protein [Holophagaceae bacterium]|nr:TldD/PmbA family protein [Holophagaceae bacterium]